MEKLSSLGISDLEYALANGIIDSDTLGELITMKKREEILKQHPYTITLLKSGYYSTHIMENGERKQIKKKNRKDLEDVLIKRYEAQKETIGSIFRDWHDRRFEHGNLEESSYVRMDNRFIKVFSYQDWMTMPIKDISPKAWAKWLEDVIYAFKMTRKDFTETKTLIRGIIRYSLREELISYTADEVFERVEINKNTFRRTLKKDEEEVFTETEWNKYREFLLNNPDTRNLAILLIFCTGMRIGEVCALSPQDITIPADKEDPCFITVSATEQAFSKGKGTGVTYKINDKGKTDAAIRTILIPNNFTPILKRIKNLNPFGEFCFVDETGKRLSTRAIRGRHDRNLNKLGLQHKSPHKIRKTYSTILDENNVDHAFIIKQMGHTDFRTTQDSYIRDRKSRQEKKAILDGIKDFAI